MIEPTSHNKLLGRPPLKQRSIVDAIHRDIIAGVLPPGSQLPSRRELVARFGGSFLTLQQALDQLAGERFVEVRGAAGTFVTERPPHLHDYALVFSQTPDSHGFRRFWTALSNEAHRLNRLPDATRRITSWYGIDGHADNEDFQQLVSLVQRRRLAGLIFASSPFLLQNTSLLDEPGIPRAAISDLHNQFADVSLISLDTISFLKRSIEHLARSGRRRVAIISVPGLNNQWDENALKLLRHRRMITKPYWNLHIEPSMGPAIRSIAHLLMHEGQDVRPDALIIADDNLVEPVTAGLIDAGVRVPADLEIVAHCNFPWPTPSVLPVCRLGFDASEVLAACLHAVDEQRESKKPTKRAISIDARFEHEVPIRTKVQT